MSGGRVEYTESLHLGRAGDSGDIDVDIGDGGDVTGNRGQAALAQPA